MDEPCETKQADVVAIPATNSPWIGLVSAVVLVLLTLIVYSPVSKCGFIWDDDSYVTANHALRDADGLRRIWSDVQATPQYYPLVHSSFWLEYHLWKLNPVGFHFVNVLLHALSAVLLWRVLARLEIKAAWLAALIFALHPVEVESVAWITERKNVLSAFFYFSAALVYLKFAGWTGPSRGARNWMLYLSALALFIAALLSKTVTCSLPAALLLVCWWKRGRLQRSDVLPLLPFFAAGVGLSLLTVWLEKNHVGASGAAFSFSFAERVLIAGRALWFYATKLLCPTSLSFIYPRWQINVATWWQWLFPVAAALTVFVLWIMRQRIGRGPLTAVLFFAGTVGPALGFINVYPMKYSFVADHFQYLASVGLIVLIATGFARLPKFAIYGLPIALGFLTWQQTAIYRGLETLWQDTLRKNPGSFLAHNNLAHIYLERGDNQQARTHLEAALATEAGDAELHYNYGYILSSQHDIVNAVEQYRQCVRLKTNHVGALHNLSWYLATAQDDKIRNGNEAFELAKRACDLTKWEDIRCFDSVDAAFAENGDFPKAIAVATEALERAKSINNHSLAEQAQQRLMLYQQGRPFRQ